MSPLSVLILTFNEERHIARCVTSAFQVAQNVYIVDSFSSDQTVAIANTLGAKVWQHEFKNHADQIAWALEHLPIGTQWVMRVDADEVISQSLANEISQKLPLASDEITGFLVFRRVRFGGSTIRYGGVAHWVLRIWRTGMGEVEQRWMDEHIVLTGGKAARLMGDYFDDNLNGVTWWTAKHNGYATREAIDLLNGRYCFLPKAAESKALSHQSSHIRWLKENLYMRLPLGARAFLFFFYRMTFRLGFLDGRTGFVFHFLQCFWYRFLVDVKVWEVEKRMAADKLSCIEAIRAEFGVDPRI